VQKGFDNLLKGLNKQEYPGAAVNINYIYKWDVATVGQAPAENQVVVKETVDVIPEDVTA